MKLFRRSQSPAEISADVEPEADADEVQPVQTEGWTRGSDLGSKALSALLMGAVVCGPVAFGLQLIGGDTELPVAVATAPVETGLTLKQQRAGAYGEQFLSAYFRATRDNPSPLDPFLANFDVTSTVAVEYRDLVVGVVDEGEPGQFTVTLGALINEVTAGGDPAMQWMNRQYQVAIAEVDGVLMVMAPPMLVQETTGLNEVASEYESVAAASPVWTAANDFLVPYFTGSGDITRSVTPGSELTTPSSPNYVAIDLAQVGVIEEVPGEPANGDVLHLEATIRATSAAESVHTYTAWITLTARDSRWEVSSLDPYPFTATTSETPND